MKKIIKLLMAFTLVLSSLTFDVKAEEKIVINVVDYGGDPSGIQDSTQAIYDALQAAKQYENESNEVVLNFEKGEYQIYKDYAQKREYHTSNTNSIENPIKTIGILIEGHQNLTIEGNDSLFMMHGNMMALAIVDSQDITLKNFAWDFEVPTVSEMSIVEFGEENGKQYTDFYIPACFPYEINNNSITWYSEKSPYTNEYYWSANGIHNAYSVVAYHPESEMTRVHPTSATPFANVQKIEKKENGIVRITYNGNRPSMQTLGMVLELCGSVHRETAGAFNYESENILIENVDVHFMHGFGWLTQMSKNITYRSCNFMPRENSGHISVSFADIIHASGASGKILIEDCHFSNSHDDPINIHGTFTRVEQRIDDHTLKLKYIHSQQGGFPQYHIGDQVQFFTRNTLQSQDNEKLYTVKSVINPGEEGNDLRTSIVTFEESLPTYLADTYLNQPNYVAENVTYAPEVTIKNNTFKNIATRAILCTTRKEVLIEGNEFLNMSMATIFLSNDSNDWYESGPIRDMTIRNNKFYIKSIGGETSWKYAGAIYIHPVTRNNELPSSATPIHKNICIENNEFYMDNDTVVKAESVENLIIKNNKIIRYYPNITMELSAKKTNLSCNEGTALSLIASGDIQNAYNDNVFDFTACKNVSIYGNTYDDGMKNYAVIRDMEAYNLTVSDPIQLVTSDMEKPFPPLSKVRYVSSNPSIITVNQNGMVNAIKKGNASVYAYYMHNDTMYLSNKIDFTVLNGDANDETLEVSYQDDVYVFENINETFKFETNVDATYKVSGLTSETSDVISVSEDGVVSAHKAGVAILNIAFRNEERKILIQVMDQNNDITLNDFSIVRSNESNFKLDSSSAFTIDMEAGDLYQSDNTLKNLVLFEGDFDRNDFVATIDIEGLPIREQGQWDTASFILYDDDNNYITIGKKSHYDGFSYVIEQNGIANEYGGNVLYNDITSGTFAIAKKDSEIKLYYIDEDNNSYLCATLNSFLSDNFKIGFGAWESNNRGKKVTFSNFRLGKANELASILNTTPINFALVNEKPVVSNITFDKDTYNVREVISPSFTYSDDNSESISKIEYIWKYQLNDKVVYEYSNYTNYVSKTSGELTCYIIAYDGNGASSVIQANTVNVVGNDELNDPTIYINGIDMIQEQLNKIYLPKAINDITLAINPTSSRHKIMVLLNGEEVSDYAILRVEDQDQLVIKVGNDGIGYNTYRYSVVKKDLSVCEFASIYLETLNTTINDFTIPYTTLKTTNSSTKFNVKISEDSGSVKAYYGAYRKEITLIESDSGYEGNIDLVNGLNSIYIDVVAKDGITTSQYIMNIVYLASNEVEISDILINDQSLSDFDINKLRYLYLMNSDEAKIEVVSKNDIILKVNDEIKVNEIMTTKIKHQDVLQILVKGNDGISKKVYEIVFSNPSSNETDLFSFVLNGESYLDDYQSKDQISTYVKDDQVQLSLVSIDPQATIKVSTYQQTYASKGALDCNLTIYNNDPSIKVEVIAQDETSKQFIIDLQKLIYLSDLNWETNSTTGYGSLQKDLEVEGIPISLIDENSNKVVFEKGIGAHANCTIYYNIESLDVSELHTFVGVDASQKGKGSVIFSILVDGKEVYRSNVKTSSDAFDEVSVELNNAKVIALKADIVENDANDHADFADAKLIMEFDSAPLVIKEQLCEKIQEVKAMDMTKYSDESVKKLMAVLNEAQMVYEQVDSTQKQVDQMIESLNEAIQLLQLKPVKQPMNFKDVQDKKTWYYKVVEQAYFADLMSATGKKDVNDPQAKFFEPDTQISRGMVATVLYRMAGQPKVEFKAKFSDVTNAKLWYSTAITWASQNNVVSGYKDGSFGPDDSITRQDLAIMLRNYAKAYGINTNVKIDFSAFKDGNKVVSYAQSAVAFCIDNKLMSGSKQKDGSVKLNPNQNATRAECAKMFVLLHELIKQNN